MAEQQDTTFHSNPFRAMMNQLSMVLKSNPISVLTLGLLMLAVIAAGIIVLGILAGIFNSTAGNALAVVLGIVYVVYVFFRFIAASYLLHIASREGRSLTARQALDEAVKKNYRPFVLTVLATDVILLIGLVAFLIPGIYLLGRLAFAPYIALNEGLGVMDSLKRSWKISNGHWFEVIGALIASAVTLSNGLLSFVGSGSGLASRYFELSHLDMTGGKKQETHWMNYFLVGAAIVFMGIYGVVLRTAHDATNQKNDTCTVLGMHIDNCTTDGTQNIPFSDPRTDDYYSSPSN